jgi:hypothetical protein
MEEYRQLMLRYCSLGENCEFGQAQRIFGAEPLDLFRWSTTGLAALIEMLNDRFASLSDPSQIEVVPAGREYMVTHRGYGCWWHGGWTTTDELTVASVYERECERLPWLAEKLLAEIADASRIFVVKREHPIPQHIASELLSAMHTYGPATLLVVEQGGDGIERAGDHLLRARIPRFADPGAVPSTTPAQDWLRVCRKVAEAVAYRQASPTDTRDWHDLLERLCAEQRLDELDAAFVSAPGEVQFDLDVSSIWAAVPRMLRDGPEMLRRAELLVNRHPRESKPVAHLIYALAATGPYRELCRRIAVWEKYWPDDWNVLGPAANVALRFCDYDRAIAIWQRAAAERPELYTADVRRSHVIALRDSGRRERAASLLAEARAAFPEYPDFDGFGT